VLGVGARHTVPRRRLQDKHAPVAAPLPVEVCAQPSLSPAACALSPVRPQIVRAEVCSSAGPNRRAQTGGTALRDTQSFRVGAGAARQDPVCNKHA